MYFNLIKHQIGLPTTTANTSQAESAQCLVYSYLNFVFAIWVGNCLTRVTPKGPVNIYRLYLVTSPIIAFPCLHAKCKLQVAYLKKVTALDLMSLTRYN